MILWQPVAILIQDGLGILTREDEDKVDEAMRDLSMQKNLAAGILMLSVTDSARESFLARAICQEPEIIDPG